MPPTVATSSTIVQPIKALVHAPPGHSKTFSSLTLSDKCPADFTHQDKKVAVQRTPPVLLDDLLWLSFDSAATIGMKQVGLDVPAVDLSGILTLTFEQDLNAVGKIVEAQIAKLGPRRRLKVVLDTISALDGMAENFQQRLRGLGGYDLWRAVKKNHADFYGVLRPLACDLYYLSHSKAVSESTGTDAVSAQQRRVKEAAGLAGIVPSISGSSLQLYRGEATFIFTIEKQPIPAPQGGGSAYFFRAEDTGNVEVKRRLKLLNEKGETQMVVPADWRVVRKMAGLA